VTVHRDKFLIIKPTRCTNFKNLFLKRNSTCFGQFLCPSSGVFHCKHSNGICHTVLLTAYEQDQDGTAVPSWSCSTADIKSVWHIPLLFVQWKTPDDGQSICPKHVELLFKNKFEKLVHLVGFIIRSSKVPSREDKKQALLSSLTNKLGFANFMPTSVNEEIQRWLLLWTDHYHSTETQRPSSIRSLTSVDTKLASF